MESFINNLSSEPLFGTTAAVLRQNCLACKRALFNTDVTIDDMMSEIDIIKEAWLEKFDTDKTTLNSAELHELLMAMDYHNHTSLLLHLLDAQPDDSPDAQGSQNEETTENDGEVPVRRVRMAFHDTDYLCDESVPWYLVLARYIDFSFVDHEEDDDSDDEDAMDIADSEDEKFIVGDDVDVESENEYDAQDDDMQAMEEGRAYASTETSGLTMQNGVRRSRRQRKPVQTIYDDPAFRSTFQRHILRDVETEHLDDEDPDEQKDTDDEWEVSSHSSEEEDDEIYEDEDDA